MKDNDRPRRGLRPRRALHGLLSVLLVPLMLYGMWTLQVIIAPPIYGILDGLPGSHSVAAAKDVMDKSAEIHGAVTSEVISLVNPAEVDHDSQPATRGTLDNVDSTTAPSMAWDEWAVFASNGIVERRMRFEQFSPPPTPASVVHDFVAYLDREIVRTESIEPEACWAGAHAAYLDVVRNDRVMLEHVLAGEMAEAEALLDETGDLNYQLTAAQCTAAVECGGDGEAMSDDPAETRAAPREQSPTPRPTLSATDRLQLTLRFPMVPTELRDRIERASTCAELDEITSTIGTQKDKVERKLKKLIKEEKRDRRQLQAERKNPTFADGLNMKRMYKSFIEANERQQAIRHMELDGLAQASEYAAVQQSELHVKGKVYRFLSLDEDAGPAPSSQTLAPEPPKLRQTH